LDKDTYELATGSNSGENSKNSSQMLLPFPLQPQLRFETFYSGENKVLLDQLKSTKKTGILSAPVWLWGKSGSGKTHLLQAVCAATNKRAIYLPLSSLKQKPEVLDDVASLDVVALDDVDVVIGDPEWDQALFSVFNGLWNEGGTLLCSSKSPPRTLNYNLPDLHSRAGGSDIYQIKSLSEPDSILALRMRAQFIGLDLSEESAKFLAKRVRRDMGTLCFWLEKLQRAAILKQRKLTIPFIRDYLG